jgi:formylmethanofuran dehydrogenase subunit E
MVFVFQLPRKICWNNIVDILKTINPHKRKKIDTVIPMTHPIKTYTDAVEFHGHACPGLALGYRAAQYAMDALKAGRSDDEELICIVENDACGVDAIQVVAGCSVGKGNLILRDLGKHAYTFIDRKYSRAIRLVQRPEPVVERIDPQAAVLRPKVMSGMASIQEQKEFQTRQVAIIEKVLAMPIEELFVIKEVKPDIPEKARIFCSVQCASCGEMVAEHRARVSDGKFVCIPCAGDYSRGWK